MFYANLKRETATLLINEMPMPILHSATIIYYGWFLGQTAQFKDRQYFQLYGIFTIQIYSMNVLPSSFLHETLTQLLQYSEIQKRRTGPGCRMIQSINQSIVINQLTDYVRD